MTTVSDKSLNRTLLRQLSKARRQNADSLEKLSSGEVFTKQDSRPTDRAIADKFEYRLRSLASSKRNINDGISLVQTAESGLAEVSNMVTRMKELNLAAASETVSNQERRFLLIEYEALRNEVDRVAQSTTFNDIPILDMKEQSEREELIFRLDDPSLLRAEKGQFLVDGEDIHTVNLNVSEVSVRPEQLGLLSASELLLDSEPGEGIEREDIDELLEAEEDDLFATSYDQALNRVAEQRAMFGSTQVRFQRALDFIDVSEENIEAARSRIADTDVAKELTNMVEARILAQASTSLLAQNNLGSTSTMRLVQELVR